MLLTAGTRGDVEPFIALARQAVAEGHIVRVALPDGSDVDTSGIDTVSLHINFAGLISTQGVSPLATIRTFRSSIRPATREMLITAARESVAFRPHVIVYHPKVLSAPLAAAALGVPHILAEIVPVLTPTRDFPAAGLMGLNLGVLNRATYGLAASASQMFATELAAVANGLSLSPAARITPPVMSLVPVSRTLLPRPADWPHSTHITGAWTQTIRSANNIFSTADASLREFLRGGPFVYAGFGSMVAGDAAARGRAIITAARARGLRTLIATGWGGIVVPPDMRGSDVLVVDSVPHALVFPRAFAVIHHGGSGTTHAAVRAGVPSIVVPFIADQPFWGKRLQRKGLGPAPIPYWRMTAARLERALALAPLYRHTVVLVAQQMAAERAGVEAALTLIVNQVRTRRRGPLLSVRTGAASTPPGATVTRPTI
jgi:sterol 3beta-glucosyltransferase